jgi:hypothetical protein
VNTSQEKIARIHIRMLKTVQAAAQHGLPMNERRFCHIDKKYSSHPPKPSHVWRKKFLLSGAGDSVFSQSDNRGPIS